MKKLTHREATLEIQQSELYVKQILQPGAPEEPVLVFLHDALGCVAGWKDLPESISRQTGLNALLYDREGHGRSRESGASRDRWYLHHEALEVLPAVLDVMEVDRPLLFGHSDGASIALLYASRHPTVGLILEAPHVVVEPRTLNGIRKAIENREGLEKKLEKYHGHKTIRLVSAWADTWLDHAFADWDIRAALERIQCPVLVFQCTDDEYGTQMQVSMICKRVPGPCNPVLLNACGHRPHGKKKEEVLERVLSFTRTHIPFFKEKEAHG